MAIRLRFRFKPVAVTGFSLLKRQNLLSNVREMFNQL